MHTWLVRGRDDEGGDDGGGDFGFLDGNKMTERQ